MILPQQRSEKEGADMAKHSIVVPAKDESLNQVLELVEGILEENDCPMKEQMMITVCVEEIAVNVFHYAYPEDTEANQATLTVDADVKDGCIEISFTDNGIPYNPLEKEDPDITLPVEERPIGGLGIFMVKKKMDNVSYRYEEGKNIFRMETRIKP